MEIAINEKISLLDQVKMQAQVLVPLLQAFRKELGPERANEIAAEALRGWSRNLFHRIASETPGSPKEKWEKMTAAQLPRIGDAVDIEMLDDGPEAVSFNVTGCRYADFFRALGEPELGAVLLCETDDHLAAVGRPEVDFQRTQTIMKGGSYCDFRYKMK